MLLNLCVTRRSLLVGRTELRRNRVSVGDVGFIGVAGLVILAILVAIGSCIFMAGFGINNAMKRSDVHNCVVENKEAVAGSSSNQYRVYTENCGVFSVEDSLFAKRWDAADTYNDIKVGQTYDFHVQGGRYPFFSMFPNVLELEAVK